MQRLAVGRVIVAVIIVVAIIGTAAFAVSSFAGRGAVSQQSAMINNTSSHRICNSFVEGNAFYILVDADSSGVPVKNATVSVTQFLACGNSSGMITTTQTISLGSATTTSNGLVSVFPYAGEYSVEVEYRGHAYNFSAFVNPLETTNATLSVPSGHLQVIWYGQNMSGTE